MATPTPTDTDLTGSIASQALEPIASSADGQSNTGRSMSDLIKAQQFLDAKAAMQRKRRGIMTTRCVTPGPFDYPAHGYGGCGFDGGYW